MPEQADQIAKAHEMMRDIIRRAELARKIDDAAIEMFEEATAEQVIAHLEYLTAMFRAHAVEQS